MSIELASKGGDDAADLRVPWRTEGCFRPDGIAASPRQELSFGQLQFLTSPGRYGIILLEMPSLALRRRGMNKDLREFRRLEEYALVGYSRSPKIVDGRPQRRRSSLHMLTSFASEAERGLGQRVPFDGLRCLPTIVIGLVFFIAIALYLSS